MAAVNFPNSPSVNDTHTSSGSTWKWDGGVWQRLGTAGPQGAQGVQGAQGRQGAQGVQGAVNNLSIATSPPGSPAAGDLWWDSDDGDLHTYFNDGNSSQWVNINNGPAGAQGAQGVTGAAGAQGAQGRQGAAGAQGAQGHQGVQGAANATTINNNANNRLITGSGTANTLEAEANLTFDGNNITQTIDASGEGISIETTGNYYPQFTFNADRSSENQSVGYIRAQWNDTDVAAIDFVAGPDTTNKDDGHIRFQTRPSGSGIVERLRIDSTGHMGLGIAPNDIDSIGRALNIASSTGGAIYLQDTDSPTGKFAAISYNGGTAALQIHAHHGASYIDLGTDGTERIRIDSSGMTGVRTAVPRATLHVKAHDNNWEAGLLLEDNTGSDGWNIHPESSDSSLMIGYNDDVTTSLAGQSATTKVKIMASGFIGVGVASPNHMLQLHRSDSNNSYTQYTNSTTGSAAGDGVWLGMGSDEICYLWQQENNHMILGTNNTERMRITSAGKVEMGSGGTYGSSPMTLNLGSRANNVAGSLAIARGEALGGGTGPYMQLVHGPDGGTQRTHELYSYVGDFRIVADSNENMELHTGGSSTVNITSAKKVGINCDPDSALEIRSTAGSYTPILKISNHHSGAYAGGIKFESFYSSTVYETAAIYGYGGSSQNDGILAFQTRTTERMRIDKDGNVTKPSNPSFAAYRAQSSWGVSGGAEMVFNATRHNNGSHYSTSTGRFTAPVTGHYLMCFFSIYTGNYNSAYIRMFKNGGRQVGSDIHYTHNDNSGHWDNIAYSQVWNLTAGDYISMFNGAGTVTYHGNHWQMFSGYLLG